MFIYEEYIYDLKSPLEYEKPREYFKSCINVIRKRGYDLGGGFDVIMDSEIPIGKGMCSSSTMIVVLIKAILEIVDADIKDDRATIARMAYEAEVAEFNEPGGMMDHMASAFGGVCRFDFNNMDNPVMEKLKPLPEGVFILFDSLQRKDTIRVLETARRPVEQAVKFLGVKGIKDIDAETVTGSNLPGNLSKPTIAALENYEILLDFKKKHSAGSLESEKLGAMLYNHHCRLRDGLGISTESIEQILDTAMSNGAWGGKLNGTGGGGCCFVFAPAEKAEQILSAVEQMGFPGRIVNIAEGVGVDKEESE